MTGSSRGPPAFRRLPARWLLANCLSVLTFCTFFLRFPYPNSPFLSLPFLALLFLASFTLPLPCFLLCLPALFPFFLSLGLSVSLSPCVSVALFLCFSFSSSSHLCFPSLMHSPQGRRAWVCGLQGCCQSKIPAGWKHIPTQSMAFLPGNRGEHCGYRTSAH